MVDGDGVPLRFRDVEHARGVVHDNLGSRPEIRSAVRYAVPHGRGAHRSAAPLSQALRGVRAVCVRRDARRGGAAVAARRRPSSSSRTRRIERPVAGAWAPSRSAALRLAVGAACSITASRSRAALADHAEAATPWLACAAAREPKKIEPVLGMMRVAVALGQTDEVVALAARAVKIDPAHPASHYLAATVAAIEGVSPPRGATRSREARQAAAARSHDARAARARTRPRRRSARRVVGGEAAAHDRSRSRRRSLSSVGSRCASSVAIDEAAIASRRRISRASRSRSR